MTYWTSTGKTLITELITDYQFLIEKVRLLSILRKQILSYKKLCLSVSHIMLGHLIINNQCSY